MAKRRCIVCDHLFTAPDDENYGVNVREGKEMCPDCLYYIRSARKTFHRSVYAEYYEWEKKQEEQKNRERRK